MAASQNGDVDGVKYLLRMGASVNEETNEKVTIFKET